MTYDVRISTCNNYNGYKVGGAPCNYYGYPRKALRLLWVGPGTLIQSKLCHAT